MALTSTGKVFYSATFLVLVPSALIAWAASTAHVVSLPAIRSFPLGASAAALGAALALLAMRDLWVHGDGLPMNAHPPPRYVTRGTYRLFSHPIYTGFSLLCVGTSILTGSASGFWLVSPAVMLGCAALVIGYEQHGLRRRFGPVVRAIFPPSESSLPSFPDRLRCWLHVVLPWTVLWWAVELRAAPVRPSSLLYSILLLAPLLLAPFVVSTCEELRRFVVRGLVAMLVAFALFLALPIIFPVSAFLAHPWVGHPGSLEPQDDLWTFVPSAATVCAWLPVEPFAERWPSARWFLRGLAVAITLGLLLIGRSGFLGTLAGMIAVAMASRVESVWRLMRRWAERLANSWKEWRSGQVRLINHGFYAGIGGVVGLWLASVLAGPGHLLAILLAAFTAVVGAALWAQYVEGSPQLLRPYGFYGG